MDRRASRRKLITTADDFGYSAEVNEAVVRAYRDGVLRHASLMVAAEAAAEAVELAKREAPGLGLGIHLVLCQGRSALPAARLPGLVDAGGRFPDDPVLCGLRYFFDRGLYSGLETELRAQFERFLAFGLRPGHVDGHVNIHVHPVVFPLAARLGAEYGFGRLRLPGGEFRASLGFSRRRLMKQLVETSVFGALRAYLLRVTGGRLAVADRTYGLLRSGLMSEDYVLAALESLPEGLSELYFHPTADPGSAVLDEPTPRHHTVTELKALTSPAVKKRLEELGIELA